MGLSYKQIRNLYYGGILVLGIYAFPMIPSIHKYIYPLLQYEIVPQIPVISVIATLTLGGAFMAYRYRKIG